MEHHTSPYAVDAPYPSIEQVVANPGDLRLIYGLYAGAVSEYTAIAQYVYHHLYAQQEGLADIGRTLLGIAIVEMRHLNLLGGLIWKLGGDPRFITPTSCGYAPWNGNLVDYGCNLKQMLLLDVKSEQGAICGYLQGVKKASQKEVSALL